MKKFLEEFKAFALRGNVVDMAIGVLIGGAFSTLVTAFTDDFITPILSLIGGTEFGFGIALPNGSFIAIGAFISAVINFLIMAFIVFTIMKAMNKLANLGKKKEEEAPAPAPEIPADVQLLTEIRDMLKTAAEQNK